MLTLKWNWGLAANSLKHLAKLAKLATALTAVTTVKAGNSEFTLNDGIKYLSNVDVYPINMLPKLLPDKEC